MKSPTQRSADLTKPWQEKSASRDTPGLLPPAVLLDIKVTPSRLQLLQNELQHSPKYSKAIFKVDFFSFKLKPQKMSDFYCWVFWNYFAHQLLNLLNSPLHRTQGGAAFPRQQQQTGLPLLRHGFTSAKTQFTKLETTSKFTLVDSGNPPHVHSI